MRLFLDFFVPIRTPTKPVEQGEQEQRRERERARDDAARQKERERRQHAVAKAQKALDAARRGHERNATDLKAQIEFLERKSQIGKRCFQATALRS